MIIRYLLHLAKVLLLSHVQMTTIGLSTRQPDHFVQDSRASILHVMVRLTTLTFRRYHQTSAFPCPSVDHLNDVYEFLLVAHGPIYL